MVVAEAFEYDCDKLKGSTYYFFVEKLGQLDGQLYESEGSSLGVYVSLVRGGRLNGVTITSGRNETCWMVWSVVALSPIV